jgi:hypothetical protein
MCELRPHSLGDLGYVYDIRRNRHETAIYQSVSRSCFAFSFASGKHMRRLCNAYANCIGLLLLACAANARMSRECARSDKEPSSWVCYLTAPDAACKRSLATLSILAKVKGPSQVRRVRLCSR